MQFFSTRTKLIFILSLILLSGFFVTNVISYRASKKQIHSSIVESSLPLARDNVYSEIQRDLTRPIFVSSLMANDTFLKELNDTLGHLAGDRIVSDIARLAGQTIRDNDMLVRWGGDEFVILTFTDTNKAVSIARRLQKAIHDHDFLISPPGGGKKQAVTISCGIAGYLADDTLDILLARAVGQRPLQSQAQGPQLYCYGRANPGR